MKLIKIDKPVLLWEDLWSLDQLRDQDNMSWLWKWVVWLRVLITLLFAFWGFSLNYLISCHWISVSLSHWTWRNIFVIFIHHVKLFHQLNTQEMTFYQSWSLKQKVQETLKGLQRQKSSLKAVQRMLKASL